MIRHHFRKPSFWLILSLDISLLVAAHLCSYLIRFEGNLSPVEWANILVVLPLLTPFKIGIFIFFGLYRGMWRYTSLTDLISILKACFIISLVAMGCLLMINRFQGYSRAVFLLDGLLTFIFIAGLRISLRLFFSFHEGKIKNGILTRAANRKNLVIIGAGDAAEKIIREVNENRTLPYNILAMLDDNRAKIGQRIHGVSVAGAIRDLPDVARKMQASEILIAIPSATRDQINRVVELCRSTGLPFKTLPSLNEIISDRLSIKSIREVSYRDLLGRPPVRLELEKIEEVLEDKVVLVSGAGGSIGSELCRQIIRFKPALLILFDASEENLYRIEMEILHESAFMDYIPVLGKVQEPGLLAKVFGQYKPEVVFHAAAYKHVPMIENNPWEAVSNNIIATRTMMEISIANNVERFILVSTDKAVRPTNVMGASKRMTELIMQAYCERSATDPKISPTKLMAVRFGNVLGSSGSVVPLFKRQIEMGGPVTVTGPDMTRYFMSIEEAAQLILQAASMGEGGEIFILEMGTPVNIAQMARELIRLCGREPDTEIEVRYIGLRPGEKLYEELITEGEGIIATAHEKIMVLRAEGPDLENLKRSLAKLYTLAENHDAEGIKKKLKEIIPEYTPRETRAVLN